MRGRPAECRTAPGALQGSAHAIGKRQATRLFRALTEGSAPAEQPKAHLRTDETGYSFTVIPKREPKKSGPFRDREFGPESSLGSDYPAGGPAGPGYLSSGPGHLPSGSAALAAVPPGPDFVAERTARDRQLRDRIVRGDSGAAEILLGEHLDSLFEFVHYRIGRDRSRVEDVVQETFLVALRDIGSFDGRSSLHTWLCGIAKNKIRSERRKRAPMSLEDALANSDAEIDSILSDVSREPLPDAVLEKQETRDLVGATLSSLPPDYRRALIEKYVEGRSTAEIAGRVNKSEKAAESTLTRARVAFARVFELLAKKRGGLG